MFSGGWWTSCSLLLRKWPRWVKWSPGCFSLRDAVPSVNTADSLRPGRGRVKDGAARTERGPAEGRGESSQVSPVAGSSHGRQSCPGPSCLSEGPPLAAFLGAERAPSDGHPLVHEGACSHGLSFSLGSSVVAPASLCLWLLLPSSAQFQREPWRSFRTGVLSYPDVRLGTAPWLSDAVVCGGARGLTFPTGSVLWEALMWTPSSGAWRLYCRCARHLCSAWE